MSDPKKRNLNDETDDCIPERVNKNTLDSTLPDRRQRHEKHALHCDMHRLERSKFPNFKKPTQLARFSTKLRESEELFKDYPAERDEETSQALPQKFSIALPYRRTLCENDETELSEIVLPPSLNSVNFDLNKRFGDQVVKQNDNEFMSLLIECLVRDNLVGKSDFVCWRGLLTEISATPYDAGGKFDEGMTISVQKIGDTFYMYKFDTEITLKKREEMTPHQKKMGYWGMKFESFVSAPIGKEPDFEAVVNYNKEFVSVVSTKLGSHSMIFGGEVDGCDPEDKGWYVELKTTRRMDHPRQEYSFRRFKLMKWWLQSFLLGIDRILCGYRDDDGIISRLEWYKISDIPRIIRQDRHTWMPEACLSYLQTFLDFIKENVTQEYQPYVLRRQAGEKMFEMQHDVAGEFKFLPLWFINHLVNPAKQSRDVGSDSHQSGDQSNERNDG